MEYNPKELGCDGENNKRRSLLSHAVSAQPREASVTCYVTSANSPLSPAYQLHKTFGRPYRTIMNTTPADYTINIQNHSGKSRAYFCWPARPFITPWPEGGVHRCIQIAASKVPAPKGSVMFSLNMKPYAITGTSNKPLSPGISVDIRDSRRVQICTMDAHGDVVKTSTGNVYGAALEESGSGCETLGSFSIETDGEEHESKSGKLGFW